MSATTENAQGTAQNTPDLENLPDARIGDKAIFATALDVIVKATKVAVREAKKAYGATDALAQATADIRALIVKPDGFPDWAGNTDAYSVAVQNVLSPILLGLGTEGKRRLDQATRQQLRRKFMLPRIVLHCLQTTNGLGEELTKFESGEEGRSYVLANPSAALIAEVRKQYRSTAVGDKKALQIPEGTPFVDVTQTPTPPVDPSDPPSVLASLDDALAGLENIIPVAALLGILKSTSGVSVNLTEAKIGAIKDRERCAQILYRLSVITGTTARMIDTDTDTKVTDEEEKELTAALFDKKNDAL